MPVFTDDIPRESEDKVYARDISFPFTFDADGDLLMDEDVEIIDQSLQLITFIPQGSIRLTPEMGSAVKLAVFDQLDEEATLIIDTSLRTAYETSEPRVFLDKEFIFDESADESTLIVMVPYKIKVTGELVVSKLTIPRPLVG